MAVRKEFPLEELEALYAESPRDAIGAVCDELSAEDSSTLARQLLTALSHERDESRLHVLVLQASLMSDYGQAWPGTDGDITLDPQLIDVLLQRRQRHFDNPSLWSDLTFLLIYLTPTDELRSRAVDAGIIEATLAMQEIYPLDPRVQGSSCFLLCHLNKSLTARKRACATNAVSILLKGLQLHCQAQPTQRSGGNYYSRYGWNPLCAWIAYAVHSICTVDDGDDPACFAARESHVSQTAVFVPALLIALRTFPAAAILQTAGCSILRLVCEQQPCMHVCVLYHDPSCDCCFAHTLRERYGAAQLLCILRCTPRAL